MTDGNNFDVTVYSQPRLTHSLSLEEMGNVLLDAMQGTLICLDQHHTIVDVSNTIKNYFGFEQTEIIGLSILLLIEDSERDRFNKFLNSSSKCSDLCAVRMMTATSNEYRQVKVHRKKKITGDSIDVHSTTTSKSNSSIRTILVLTLNDSSYIDINLFDIHKQEFYTKMNLAGEIIFEDHRAALITGYLPHELISHSIFNFVYQEDRLVKLHALWKCVTTGTSKLQWRFNARNGSIVFLNTEYKLISNHLDRETIVARNEVLSPSQQAQFDDLQSAWRHQCTADIRGNGSTFKLISSTDIETTTPNECRISVPSLNMYFSTNKLQSLTINGNIFEGTKLVRPLTIQDYIQILIEHDANLDSELIHLIQSISALASRQKQNSFSSNCNTVDSLNTERTSIDGNATKKLESESIVREMLGNATKTAPDNPTFHSSNSLTALLNANASSTPPDINFMTKTVPPNPPRTNSSSLNIDTIHQQHHDFMKKYRAAKTKLESQLEITRNQEMINGGQPSDVMKRNTIVNKLSQLETIKNKHLARIVELKRQALNNQSSEEKDLLSTLMNSSPNKSMPMDHNGISHQQTPLYNGSGPFYPQQQRTSSSMPFESGSMMTPVDSLSRSKSSIFDEYLNPYPSVNNNSNNNNNPNFVPMANSSVSVHSYMNVSYHENPMMPSFNTNTMSGQQPHSNHRSPYPF